MWLPQLVNTLAKFYKPLDNLEIASIKSGDAK